MQETGNHPIFSLNILLGNNSWVNLTFGTTEYR